LITELRDLIRDVFPETVEDLAHSGAGWLRGKSQQEIAKAMEIRASAMEKLGKLEIERLKLIKERDEAESKEETQRHRDDQAHEQRMFELRTERLKAVAAAKAEQLKAVVEALRVLKDLDVRVRARVASRLQSVLADIAELPEP
jgi:hypothetical protein